MEEKVAETAFGRCMNGVLDTLLVVSENEVCISINKLRSYKIDTLSTRFCVLKKTRRDNMSKTPKL